MGFSFDLKMIRAILLVGMTLVLSACSRPPASPSAVDLASSKKPTVAPVPLPRPAFLDQTTTAAKTVDLATVQKSCAFLADPKKIKNCTAAFAQVPNTQALIYSLAFMQANHGHLADDHCLPADPGRGMTHAELANSGIRNTCQFVINDVTSEYHQGSQKFPYRSNAYFIDLCKGPANVVTPFYMNKGTGTTSKYLDIPNMDTTVLGAFLTGTSVVPFTPYKMSTAYMGILRANKNVIPSLRLYGVQSTNNDSYKTKPMHISGYKSSDGCPSTGLQYQWILSELAQGGPALLMNYGPSAFHPLASINKCDAIPESQVSPGIAHAKAKTPVKTKEVAPIPMMPPPGLRSAGTS